MVGFIDHRQPDMRGFPGVDLRKNFDDGRWYAVVIGETELEVIERANRAVARLNGEFTNRDD